MFIVLNVFLMSVGERRRQISILRAIGATRRQIMTMITSEALLLGVVGTLLGIPVGIYGGRLLAGTMAQILQIDLPEAATLRWPLVVGAIFGPAVVPDRGLVSGPQGQPGFAAGRFAAASGLAVAGNLSAVGEGGDHRAGRSTRSWRVGAFWAGRRCGWPSGTVISSLIAVVLLLPVALGPAVRGLTSMLGRLGGFPLEIAERLVVRETGRSSLTVGVLFMAVAAGLGTSNAVLSITQDVHDWHDQTLTADFLLRTMMPDTTLRNADHDARIARRRAESAARRDARSIRHG